MIKSDGPDSDSQWDEDTDERHPAAVAYEWVGRIFAVCIEMIAPGIAGIWLDKQLGTEFIVILGFAFGTVIGISHLLIMANREAEANARRLKQKHERNKKQ
ncbi:MAG: hypothetical protein COA78_37475 [Blastopirellula sp.]|nr:MAG: hypothetical protein COA78_37475 [Blastopirellula sp.]